MRIKVKNCTALCRRASARRRCKRWILFPKVYVVLMAMDLSFDSDLWSKEHKHEHEHECRHSNYCHRVHHTPYGWAIQIIGSWMHDKPDKNRNNITANLTLVRNFVSVPQSRLVGTCTPCCLLCMDAMRAPSVCLPVHFRLVIIICSYYFYYYCWTQSNTLWSLTNRFWHS